MSLAPSDYDFGSPSNYAFGEKITCKSEETRKMFVEGWGHMLNYNHEPSDSLFLKVY